MYLLFWQYQHCHTNCKASQSMWTLDTFALPTVFPWHSHCIGWTRQHGIKATTLSHCEKFHKSEKLSFKVNMTSTATIVANSPGNFIIEANCPLSLPYWMFKNYSVFLARNLICFQTRVELCWETPLATWQLSGRRRGSSPSLSPIEFWICLEIWNILLSISKSFFSHLSCTGDLATV